MKKQWKIGSALLAAGVLLAGCGEQQGNANAPAEKNDQVLNGAGASFPAPVYQVWTYAYSQTKGHAKVNYQSVGSGAGLNQIKAGTVDFAGTDNPLTADQQRKENLKQFPMLTGGVVVIVNLPGVKDCQLKLSRETLAGLFQGSIKNWNDPAIRAINPGLTLPDLAVTVVHRSDASGTTAIFTDYLSKISADWKNKVGAGTAVNWPAGIGGQKNPGVCNNVAKISGGIGYTEYTYAAEAKLACAVLENQAGMYVKPTVEAFRAAASNADWEAADGFALMLTDTKGVDSWPITGVTYILLRNDLAPEKYEELKRYFQWCFESGAVSASKLNYVAIPQNVVALIEKNVLK